jgi:hypothetical protein
MRLLPWVIIAVVIGAITCAAFAAPKPAHQDEITLIEREHNPGPPAATGPWPYFIARVRSDGTAFYKGGRGTPLEGLHRGKISKADYDRLTHALREMRNQQVDGDATVDQDLPYEVLTFVLDGKKRVIYHGHSDEYMPGKADEDDVKALVQFENLFDAIMKHVHWEKAPQEPAK